MSKIEELAKRLLIKELTECRGCAHCHIPLNGDSCTELQCTAKTERRVIPDDGHSGIPEWCPLPRKSPPADVEAITDKEIMNMWYKSVSQTETLADTIFHFARQLSPMLPVPDEKVLEKIREEVGKLICGIYQKGQACDGCPIPRPCWPVKEDVEKIINLLSLLSQKPKEMRLISDEDFKRYCIKKCITQCFNQPARCQREAQLAACKGE